MILSFKHRGLEKLFRTGSKAGVQPHHAKKLTAQLTALEIATQANEMDIPGWVFHPLKHIDPQMWSVKVDGNFRLVFKFSDGNAYEVDYADYH